VAGTASPNTAASAPNEAFDELERAVRHLGEELAFFRRRALDAERRLRELTAHAPPASAGAGLASPSIADPAHGADLRSRLAALEAENGDLRDRLAEAAERTRALADRVRFVRQQQQLAEEEA
jgi:prefoldin subunit 5